ncbi:DUF2283 domain-containing protein [Candidatus Acetothermia bacterium]|nr:DUF2283 domain-containing protein [Candidatus Acetothermia bacterium]MBI3659318.1 DUF2283 domain-containing protein [Candidatus Acetothermia bacterium]
MKITYDPEADALYIYLPPEGTSVAETREVTEEIFVDLDEKDNIIGVEILSVSQQIPPREISSITLTNLLQTAQAT